MESGRAFRFLKRRRRPWRVVYRQYRYRVFRTKLSYTLKLSNRRRRTLGNFIVDDHRPVKDDLVPCDDSRSEHAPCRYTLVDGQSASIANILCSLFLLVSTSDICAGETIKKKKKRSITKSTCSKQAKYRRRWFGERPAYLWRRKKTKRSPYTGKKAIEIVRTGKV